MGIEEKNFPTASVSDDIVIRPLTERDKDIVNEFFDAMGFESSFFFNRNDGNRARVLEYFENACQSRRFWIADLNVKMAGLVFLIDWNTTVPSLGISVREDLKGMHLGSRLMDYAIEQVKRAKKGGIRLTTHFANLRGQMLYEKKGFRRMGQHTGGDEFFYLLWFPDEQ